MGRPRIWATCSRAHIDMRKNEVAIFRRPKHERVSLSVPGVRGQAKLCCGILRAGVYTDNAVGLEGHGRRICLSSVCEQWPDIALVVDLYSLLCRWSMVSRRGRLENEPIDGREYDDFSNQAGHADRVRFSNSSGVW